MNCHRRRMPKVNANAHMKPSPSKEGNGTSKHADTNGLERHNMPLPPKQKSGSVDKWS